MVNDTCFVRIPREGAFVTMSITYIVQGTAVPVGPPVVEFPATSADPDSIGDIFSSQQMYVGVFRIPVSSGWFRIYAGPATPNGVAPLLDYCVLSLAYTS